MDTQQPQRQATSQGGRDESRGTGMEPGYPTSLMATAAIQASYQQYVASQAGSPMAPLFPAHCPPQMPSAISPSMQPTQSVAATVPRDSLILPSRTRDSGGTRKRTRTQAAAPPVVSEDERKRVDRNLKEQQRSIQISTLLTTLRDILVEANIHPDSDKLSRHSTLASVVDYIKQLQHANAHFDAENQKLRKSLGKTNEVLSSAAGGQIVSSQEAFVHAKACCEKSLDVDNEGDVDYRSVFRQCGIALAAVKIDGRFIDCNAEFEGLTGYNRDELIAPIQGPNDDAEEDNKMTNTSSSESSSRGSSVDSSLTGVTTLTLFSLLDPLAMEELYDAMKHVIEDAMGKCDAEHEGSTPTESGESAARQPNFWCGKIISRQEAGELRLVVTLIRSSKGLPRLFLCALLPSDASLISN